jgi:CheY-like chemotaxis protein
VVDWIDKPIDQARLISAVKTATRAGLPGGNRPRILHIEDDRDLVQVVAALLAEAAQVSSARTVKEALARLEQEKFDLILLDVELPDSTSASLPALLNNPALGTIPVVVFSGQEIDPEISRKIAAGLIKARTTNRELLNTIQTIFDRLEISADQADLNPIS